MSHDPTDTPRPHDETPVSSEASEDGSRRSKGLQRWQIVLGTVLALIVLVTGPMLMFGQMDTLAQQLLQRIANVPVEAEAIREAEITAPAARLQSFTDLSHHPDRLYASYLDPAARTDALDPSTARLLPEFRDLLEIYEYRQRVDDNFTIRVIDGRSNEVLEVYALDDARQAYEQSGEADWPAIDRQRRVQTRRLVDKYVARGVPKSEVMVRWGRANQVLEARQREAPYIEYEAALANHLGLSLLATEIGTVETFNQDRLVSPVGAKSRYQMMPYLLRKRGIQHYTLRTAGGDNVSVYEEWNPLLTMEPSMTLLRGYVNAVGHEIPGISAYHTGPYNIYKVYELFLSDSNLLNARANVLDAYMWAVTDGFDAVSKKSTFRTYSRGYVPSAYGALRATEQLPVDTTQTLLAELVEIEPDRQIFLSDLLRALEPAREQLDWGTRPDEASLYNHFRWMNPHIDLPRAPDSVGVPVRGDLRLTNRAGGADVRFFLPLGASQVLLDAGVTALDASEMIRYDHDLYAPPSPAERTEADRAYDALVEDIRNFGFTRANKDELERLTREFERLAEANPTAYRERQLNVIRVHRDVWRSRLWTRLADAVDAADDALRLPAQPPELLETPSARDATPRSTR